MENTNNNQSVVDFSTMSKEQKKAWKKAHNKNFKKLSHDAETLDVEKINDAIITASVESVEAESVEPTKEAIETLENSVPVESVEVESETKTDASIESVEAEKIPTSMRTLAIAQRNLKSYTVRTLEGIEIKDTLSIVCTDNSEKLVTLDLVKLGLFENLPYHITKNDFYDFCRKIGLYSTLVSKTEPSWYCNGNMFSNSAKSRKDTSALKPLNKIESSLYGINNLHTPLNRQKFIAVNGVCYEYANFTFTITDKVKVLKAVE